MTQGRPRGCVLVVGMRTLVEYEGTSSGSLVPRLCVPHCEKQSGELSRISWAYYPKRVMTNEIARLVIITYHFPYNGKISSSAFGYPYLF